VRYYLARWELDTDAAGGYWRAPASGVVGLVDLRPLAAQGTLLTVDGYGFFAYPDVVDPALMPGQIDLGNNLDKVIRNKDKVENAFGVTLSGKTITDVLWELLTTKSDPKGLTGPKPIIPGVRRNLELHLGGHSIIRAEDFDLATAPHRLQVIEVMQDVYREAKQEASRHIDSRKDTHRRMLSVFADKYREDYRTFIPSDFPDEGTKEPRTSFGDSFNRADNTDLNALDTGKTKDGGAGTWQWNEVLGDSEIVSNAFQAVGGGGALVYARCDDDMSGVDHFCEVDIGTLSLTSDQLGPCVRFASAANTSYMYMRNTASPATSSTLILRKTITGSRTDIGTSDTVTATAGEKLECRIDGSTLSGEHDDTEFDSITDTAITGGTRGGIYLFSDLTADDWFCEDIAAGGPTIIGLATETSSALGITPLKTRAVGLSSETDSAFSIARLKALTLGLPTETDTAFGITSGLEVSIGLASEADSALALAILKARAIGLASEADSALGILAGRTVSVGLSSEADSALAMSYFRTLGVGLASEADTALVVTVIGGSLTVVRVTLLNRKEIGRLHRMLRGRF